MIIWQWLAFSGHPLHDTHTHSRHEDAVSLKARGNYCCECGILVP